MKLMFKITILFIILINFFYSVRQACSMSNEPILLTEEQTEQKGSEIIEKPKSMAFVLAWDLAIPVIFTGFSVYCTNFAYSSDAENIHRKEHGCLLWTYGGLALSSFVSWTLLTDSYVEAPLSKMILTPIVKLGVEFLTIANIENHVNNHIFDNCRDEDDSGCEKKYKEYVSRNWQMILTTWSIYSLETWYHVYKARKYNNLIEKKKMKEFMIVPTLLKDRHGLAFQVAF